MKAREGESIKYTDICSLYPYICKRGRFPLGYPDIYVGKQCEFLTRGNNNGISLFRKYQSRTSSRKGRELVVPPSRTDFGLKSFWSQDTRLWNSLPRDIRYLPSASRFNSAMMRYLLERSRDADCILM